MGKGLWSVLSYGLHPSIYGCFTGGLVYIKVFGQHIVFVNSMDIAEDLFEKRSSIYSDRFKAPMMEL
jgi:hypothetical protein